MSQFAVGLSQDRIGQDGGGVLGVVYRRMENVEQFTIERAELAALLAVLKRRGYLTLGPTLRDGAIVYEEIDSVDELPVGWTEEQEGGHYRLKQRDDEAVFGFTVGPQSWKKFLFPPRQRLFRARKVDGRIEFETDDEEPLRMALIGVRSCELAAIAIQDKVFSGGAYADSIYGARRANNFIVAVNCGEAAATCFCDSMKTGPRARNGFDLSLTEVMRNEQHCFVVESGTEAGDEVLAELSVRPSEPEETACADAAVHSAVDQMRSGRQLDTDGLKDLLYENLEHPRWGEVADRCLSCANCTMVCPTCFCSTVEEVTDLTGDHAERWRRWDSCFTMEFSHLGGTPVRSSTRSRYRQWLTHKLASWQDQFDTSGCVGCGRCITWCPVGIDLTEEAAAIRANPQPDL